jgi:putative peptidoglycan lipid II flippase
MKSPRGKIAKAAGLLLVLQVVEQATGLLKQILIAAQFGTSSMMDGYLIATTIAGLILLWVGLPIRQTLIPMFRHDLAKRGEGTAWANTSVLFNNLLLVIVGIVIIAELLAPYLVTVLAPGLEEEAASSAVSLARITLASVIFVGMGNVLSQVLFSYERFFWPGIAGAVNNIVVMLALLAFGATYGIYGLAVAAVLGAACHLALQLPILWEKRKLYSGSVNLRHPYMVETGKLSLPLLISTGGNELARVTDRIFASLLPIGSLSALAFAHRPITVLIEFLIHPLNTATLPHFAKLSAEEDFRTLSRQLFHYVRVIAFFTVPIAVGLMLIAEDVIRALYQRGAFDEASVRLTGQALLFYAIGVPAQAIMRIFRNAFFNLKDTWTPTKIALVRIGIKIVLSWILVQPLAHRGIALAESLSLFANAVFLFCFLPRELKGQEVWKTLGAFAQTLAGCAVMGTVVYLVQERIDGIFSLPLEIGGLILLGAATYGLTALFFQVEVSHSLLRTATELAGRYIRGVPKTT